MITRRKKTYSFLFIVLLGAIFVFKKFIFGDSIFAYLDANDDTYQAFLPIYKMVVDCIREGDFAFFTMRSGMGANILGMQAAVFDPFAVIIYIVGIVAGTEKMAYALVWAHIARVVCAALACKYYLSCKGLTNMNQNVGAFLCAFSAYFLGDIGQHYYFGTAIVFCALLYGMIEQYNKGEDVDLCFVLIVSFVCIWSIYFAFMILLATGIYSFIKWLSWDNKEFNKTCVFFGKLIFMVMVGIMISAFVFIPSALIIINTSDRIGGTKETLTVLKELLLPWSLERYKDIFLRFFSNQLGGNINHFTGQLTAFKTEHLFLSFLLPISIIFYFCDGIKGKKQKKVVYLAVFLIAVGCFIPLAGTIMNVMVEYVSRYLFVWFPILAYVVAVFFERIFEDNSLSKEGMLLLNVLQIIFLIVIIKLTNWQDAAAKISGFMVCVCLTVSIVILFIVGILKCNMFVCKKKQIMYVLKLLLISITIGQTCIDGVVSLQMGRNIVLKDWYEDNCYDIAAHTFIEQTNATGDDFWRFERNFLAWGIQPAFKYSEIEGIRGISVYNSVINKSINKFRKNILHIENMEKIRGSYSFGSFGLPMNSVLADLYGIKYVVSDYKVNDINWELKGKSNGKYLYENKDLLSAGVLYSEWCSEEQYENASDDNKLNIVSKAVVLDKQPDCIPEYRIADHVGIELFDLDFDNVQIENGDAYVGNKIKIQTNEETCLLFALNQDNIKPEYNEAWLQIHISGDAKGQFLFSFDTGNGFLDNCWTTQELRHTGERDKVYWINMPLDAQKVKIQCVDANNLNIEETKVLYNKEKNYTNKKIYLVNSNLGGKIEGEIEADQNGVFVLPISIEDGWECYIDEKKIQPLTADYSFMAFEIQKGKHKILVQYHTPGIRLGILVSACGMIIFCCYFIFRKKSNKKQNRNI